jgi:transcriptional regulator with XRE-family HTH domain
MAQTLGSTIYNARKAKRMTQVALAEAIGVTERWVREYEKGRASNPTVDRMRKLSEALDVPLAKLLRCKAPGAAEASS